MDKIIVKAVPPPAKREWKRKWTSLYTRRETYEKLVMLKQMTGRTQLELLDLAIDELLKRIEVVSE